MFSGLHGGGFVEDWIGLLVPVTLVSVASLVALADSARKAHRVAGRFALLVLVLHGVLIAWGPIVVAATGVDGAHPRAPSPTFRPRSGGVRRAGS